MSTPTLHPAVDPPYARRHSGTLAPPSGRMEAERGGGTVKITQIETFLVRPESRNYVFVRVQTDEGIYGVGEAYSVGPDDAVVAVARATWFEVDPATFGA